MANSEGNPGLSRFVGRFLEVRMKDFGMRVDTPRKRIDTVMTVPPEETPDGRYENVIITVEGRSTLYAKPNTFVTTRNLEEGVEELVYGSQLSSNPTTLPRRILIYAAEE